MPPILYKETTEAKGAASKTKTQEPARILARRASLSFAELLTESGLRASITLPAKIDGNVNTSSNGDISEGARAAVADWTLQLKFWGKSCFDEEAFSFLLDDIGYTRPREGLFDDLLEDVAYADPNFDVSLRSISVDNLRLMYASEPYRIPEQAVFNNGEALMSFVETLFRKADVTGDNVLDYDEVTQILRRLYGAEPTQTVVDEAFKALDLNGDGQVDFEEFKSFMLKANVNDVSVSALSSDFNEAIMSPSYSTDLEFVYELEKYCKAHR